MCAREAGKRGRSVVVLDHAGRIARKVLVSGGGRCNFTNLDVRAEHYYSANPHFCKSALARFTPNDIISLLHRHGIAFEEREEGQLFCRGSAAQIVTALRKECIDAGVDFRLGQAVTSIVRKDGFHVAAGNTVYAAESLVIATGGLSWPAVGASDFGLRTARRFGLNVVTPAPALVPLRFSKRDAKRYSVLSGISINVTVGCRNRQFRGSMLFTHRGLSGPVILQISNVLTAGSELVIDLLPDTDILAVFMEHRRSRMEMHTLLSRYLPERVCRAWSAENAPSRPLNTYSVKELESLAGMLHAWKVVPAGTEGYGKAEVTSGGVDTAELSSKTMEARKIPGLYFIGEVVDVTGQLGGYNLQWAWSSGFAAGQSV